MALNQIQGTSQRQRQPSALDQIAEGVGIATNILGLGAKSYELWLGKDKNDIEREKMNKTDAPDYMKLASTYHLATPQDIKDNKAVDVPGGKPGDKYVLNRSPIDEYRALTVSTKADDKEEHDAAALQKSLETARSSSRSPLGKAANNLFAADRIGALVQPYMQHLESLTPQQVYEVARAADNVVSQGNATMAGTEHLLPKSALGDFNSFKNYLTNQPGGADMGAWVKNMYEMSQREKALAGQQVQTYLDHTARASEGGRLFKTNPERFNNIVTSMKESIFSLPDSPASQSPKIGDVEGGHQFLGGNPADPKNWKQVQ